MLALYTDNYRIGVLGTSLASIVDQQGAMANEDTFRTPIAWENANRATLQLSTNNGYGF